MVKSTSAPFTPLSLAIDSHVDLANPQITQLRLTAIPKFPDDENWVSVFVTPCAFAPSHFHHVMENLLRNPNLTSSCLFRADVLYDSDKDPDADLANDRGELRGLTKYMKTELRPKRRSSFDSFTTYRTVVRKLIPRNPALDKELVQTVCLLSKTHTANATTSGQDKSGSSSEKEQQSLVIYIPHTEDPEAIPYYHPKVHSLALLHTFTPQSHTGSLSVHYRMFAADMSSIASEEADLARPTLAKRLERTALNFLRIINKHAHGQQAGYKKRVHHDLLVDQVSFQNRYVSLKQKYAKSLMETWVEVTDPKKHVFEDIGIAAFLIEIWDGMYGSNKSRDSSRIREMLGSDERQRSTSFPGFVDIGCGNGVLVHILISEGYKGWGFDVRKRKSWAVFPTNVQDNLKELILVPEVLQGVLESTEGLEFLKTAGIHDGVFPAGTFIVSNHADQLTPWTPLLAYASNSPFISIPCCSHALNGKLWRFYDIMPESKVSLPADEGPSTSHTSVASLVSNLSDAKLSSSSKDKASNGQEKPSSRAVEPDGPGPQTGSLARGSADNNNNSSKSKRNIPSAYAGFTAYVMRLAAALDYEVESEVLRIPSTRNFSIVTRHSPKTPDDFSLADRNAKILQLLQAEIGDVPQAAKDWVEGAISLKRKAGGGH